MSLAPLHLMTEFEQRTADLFETRADLVVFDAARRLARPTATRVDRHVVSQLNVSQGGLVVDLRVSYDKAPLDNLPQAFVSAMGAARAALLTFPPSGGRPGVMLVVDLGLAHRSMPWRGGQTVMWTWTIERHDLVEYTFGAQ